MSVADTIRIAHTARCKLQLAADRPDRNLRFILGHAFTLDNLRLRIAEIEEEQEDAEDDFVPEPTPAEKRRVSFSGKSNPSSGLRDGRRSPPPPPQLEDDLEDDEDAIEDDEEEDAGLSLQRFGSAAAQAPRIADEEGSSSEDEDEEGSSPSNFTEDQLKMITAAAGNVELKDAYSHMAGCPCHGQKGPTVEKLWEVPQGEKVGPRMAVVQVAA
ncbi:hypothetical protein LSUE1_G003550 [Lachnellula suecica]|uniref:Uncharacterized protein n=1 Tax=Lachnellula suecica TaxID=602035 RepID=A0A8T9CEN7_9HELO|nr:hypothetical protein LSUE1_G003550 [Lachnellula suecica]